MDWFAELTMTVDIDGIDDRDDRDDLDDVAVGSLDFVAAHELGFGTRGGDRGNCRAEDDQGGGVVDPRSRAMGQQPGQDNLWIEVDRGSAGQVAGADAESHGSNGDATPVRRAKTEAAIMMASAAPGDEDQLGVPAGDVYEFEGLRYRRGEVSLGDGNAEFAGSRSASGHAGGYVDATTCPYRAAPGRGVRAGCRRL